MDRHENAPLTPKGREMMVRAVMDEGLSKAAAARRFNTTPKTAAKWIKRFEAEGVEGLRDRSSRPHSSPSQTAPATAAAVEALRRQRSESEGRADLTGDWGAMARYRGYGRFPPRSLGNRSGCISDPGLWPKQPLHRLSSTRA
jgi:transposase-like protein